MYVAVRECHLPGLFGSIKAGLDAMSIDAVELEYFRDRSVLSLDAVDGAKESLADEAATDSFAYKCSGLKCRVAALLLHNNLGAEDIDSEVDWVTSCVKAAGRLGVTAVRIDAIMSTERDWPLDKRIQRFADCMSKVLDSTTDMGVDLGIENHGVQGNDPQFLDTVLEKVGSPRLGITIDTGNFYWAGNPLSRVHEIIRHFAPKVKHTHIKSINYPKDKREIKREVGWEYGTYASSLPDGDIDIKMVVEALGKSGYKGSLCIENESLGRLSELERKQALIDDAAYLRGMIS